MSGAMIATIFPDKAAKKMRPMLLDAFLKTLRNPPVKASKDACELFVAAKVGSKRTAKHSLRSDDNVLEVSAITGDYDGEQVSLEDAREQLAVLGVNAILYTSPSHTPDAPRWRVVAPLSRPLPPGAHRGLAARLNAALGGILAPESKTLSQSYYFGRVNGREYQCVESAGRALDLLPDLDDLVPAVDAAPRPFPRSTETDAELHAHIVNGDKGGIYLALLRLSARLAGRGMPELEVVATLRGLLEQSALQATDPRTWKARLEGLGQMAESAARKYGDPRARDTKNRPQSGANGAGHTATPGDDSGAPAGLQSRLVSFENWDTSEPTPCYIERILPAGEVTLLGGHGGLGKSYLALLLAVHLVTGRAFAGLAVEPCKVLMFSAEDDGRQLRYRLRQLCEANNVDVDELAGRLHLLDMADADAALHRESVRYVASEKLVSTNTDTLRDLAELVRELDPGVIVIDGASDTFDGDESSRASVRAFVRSIRTKLARPHRAVLLLAHVNKATAKAAGADKAEAYSGSTAWHNSTRSRLALTGEPGGQLTLDHQKVNHGVLADPILLEFRDGVPRLVGTGAHPAADLIAAQERIRDDRDKCALVGLIRGFEQRGERVTTAAQGSATVYKLLEGEPGYPAGTDRARLMRLLRAMEHDGTLRRGTVKTADRKLREVFRTVPDAAPIRPESGPANDAATPQAAA